ncbi:Hypothetical_protein [Hexamita inflata]|uniref:Hypothetical_protein n=1 Tax=Hexamita inflata TaxID=28002 RepID=A0AA86QTF1_9EUKA|nr:Hypothetical protein HINF_LOCUS53361 [Hexamita inflata]
MYQHMGNNGQKKGSTPRQIATPFNRIQFQHALLNESAGKIDFRFKCALKHIEGGIAAATPPKRHASLNERTIFELCWKDTTKVFRHHRQTNRTKQIFSSLQKLDGKSLGHNLLGIVVMVLDPTSNTDSLELARPALVLGLLSQLIESMTKLFKPQIGICRKCILHHQQNRLQMMSIYMVRKPGGTVDSRIQIYLIKLSHQICQLNTFSNYSIKFQPKHQSEPSDSCSVLASRDPVHSTMVGIFRKKQKEFRVQSLNRSQYSVNTKSEG